MARHVERSIEVAVPVRTAYDQWTQFEEFPRFMAGVQEVRQVGDALTHWVAEIAGVRREWDAAILEQVPDEKVAWAATSGATNAGAVYFTAVAPGCTRVRLALDYEPEGVVERIGDIFDVIDRQAVADLDRFKEFIEQTGAATGEWRGVIEEGAVQDENTPGTDPDDDVEVVEVEEIDVVIVEPVDEAPDSDVGYESDAAYDADVPTTDAEELPLATGHDAPAPPPPTDRLEADDAPEVGEIGSKLEPMDPRVGTLDDPNASQR